MSISLSELYLAFHNQPVIQNLSLEVAKGEFFVLLGGSGSGKSTILRIIAGLQLPDRGRVALDGKDVSALAAQQRGVGFVFQNYALFRHMSVRKNVEFGLRIRGVPGRQRSSRAADLLALVGLTGFGERYPHQLSGGQRQRVALARALAYQPGILLLDEPFGALDVKIRGQLRSNLKQIHRQLGISTILVTHDQEEAFELADRVGVLHRGCLVECGKPQELYLRPRQEYSATFLGNGNVIVGRAMEGELRLGKLRVPMPANSAAHEDGAPVRILFRPEEVCVMPTSGLTAGNSGASCVASLGEGRVLSQAFCGDTWRVAMRLPACEGARPLAPAPVYGQRGVIIEAQVPQSLGEGLQVGDSVQVGVTRLHVLDPSGLRFCFITQDLSENQSELDFLRLLLRASHGAGRVLQRGRTRAASRLGGAITQSSAQQTGVEAHLEYQDISGLHTGELLQRVQQGAFDFVLLARRRERDAFSRAAPLVRRLLLEARVPVMLVSDLPARIERVTLCTSGGEPGKQNVMVAARLLRYLEAFVTVLHVQRDGLSELQSRYVEQHLGSAAELLDSYQIRNQIKLVAPPLSQAILDTTRTEKSDLLVLGTPGDLSMGWRRSAATMLEVLDGFPGSVIFVPGML
jgi:sulfate transport system ATP-binding protein